MFSSGASFLRELIKIIQRILGIFAILTTTCFMPKALAGETQTCPDSVYYQFLKGDTLSEVLWAVGRWRMYGPRGRIAKIIAASPHKFSNLQDGAIRRGAIVRISVDFCPDPTQWRIADGFLRRIKPISHERQTQEIITKSAHIPVPETRIQIPTIELPKTQTPTTQTQKSTDAATNKDTSIQIKEAESSPIKITEPVKEPMPEIKQFNKEITNDALSEFVND